MNNLYPSAYEKPYEETTIDHSALNLTRNFVPAPTMNAYLPETDFRSPFKKTLEKIKNSVMSVVNSVTGAAAWAPVGSLLAVASTAVVAPLLGATMSSYMLPAQIGAVVGAIKGVFAGINWTNRSRTTEHNRQLSRENLRAQVMDNMTADTRFEARQFDNAMREDEYFLRKNYDPYHRQLDTRQKEIQLGLSEMELEQMYANQEGNADIFEVNRPTDVSAKPNSSNNYFAELDVMGQR